MTTPKPSELARTLDECMCSDRPGLRRRLKRLRRGRGADRQRLASLAQDIEASRARRAARARNAPRPTYPELPIVDHRDAFRRALETNQVVVVAGETGSGKTTQLPKFCLDAGRGTGGFIGVTQPRRIAARSIASRVAEELGTTVGEAVGYKVRFKDHVSRDGYIKLMTDGILLAEMQGDRFLDHYDTLIVDEAHERSLNIDFVLGYLKRLLPKRPDLKLIISSATIDTEKYSRFFDDAPIIEVSGRMYPVEVRYRPLESEAADEQDRDMPQAVSEAVEEVCAEGPGDILVFLSGEREIREIAEYLRKHHPPHTEIVPLYSRLSAAQQNRVFHPSDKRRIVLATNIAETSLTVPGIRYVIDPGRARISRYSYRSKVQRLPIEPVSQASADQRAGRCGRVASGICIRLYSETDYQSRPRFTDPEILRTNLASVILQMKTLRLGAPEDFPFIDAPEGKRINDGFRLLHELGAVDERWELTATGRNMARMPIDPRIARMIVAARDEGCLAEILPIAAALSIPDPRERPADNRKAADEKHQPFVDNRSDFLTLWNLWTTWREQERHLSKNKLRRYCRDNFLSFVRMKEWRELYTQLHATTGELGWRLNEPGAGYAAIHRAVLSGLVSHIAHKDEDDEYRGARGSRLRIFPGSGLAGKLPKWIVAAELVETSRLFARTVARIDPAWVEAVAPHLVKREYVEPHWQRRRGRAVAYENVIVYGLTVVAGRKVDYTQIDPALSRELFIREGLVAGDYETKAGFFKHNRELLDELGGLEDKGRRRDIVADEEAIFRFYDERIPNDVHHAAAFERWRKRAEADTPQLLYLTREALAGEGASEITDTAYPDRVEVGGVDLPLTYHFEPGSPDDGVTATVPLSALNVLAPEPFEWLVPGLIEDKIAALLRSLPKGLRRQFVPVPDYAAACVQALSYREGALIPRLAAELERMTGTSIPADSWDVDGLPAHLRMNFRVVDGAGEVLDEDRDLRALQARFGDQAAAGFEQLPKTSHERSGITDWDFGDLAESITLEQHGAQLRGIPTLVDEGDSVALRVVDSPARAEALLSAGVRRLLMLKLREQTRFIRKDLKPDQVTCLAYSRAARIEPPVAVRPSQPADSRPADQDLCEALRDDAVHAVFDHVFLSDGPVRTESAFHARLAAGRERLVPVAEEAGELIAQIMHDYQQVARQLEGKVPLAWYHAVADIKEQLNHLVYAGFVARTPYERLRQYPRYLAGIATRLSKLEQAPDRDKQRAQELEPAWRAYVEALDQGKQDDTALQRYRWMVEEYRISLFAQELKTAEPVSAKRLRAQWEAVGA